MLGAIYIGLSGMNAYTEGLQTISNNVANLNTLGFKASSAAFTDLFSGGGSGLSFTSGSSGEKAGSGVRFAPPQTDFSQGELRQSDGDLDLAIQGNGFLVLKDGAQTLYTRTGQFAVDDKGFISLQGTTNHLAMLNGSNEAVAINVDEKRTSAPVATTSVKFSDNLSSTATTNVVSSIAVYDSIGGAHTWQVKFTPVTPANPGHWDVTVLDETGATVGTSSLNFIGNVPDPTGDKLTISSAPLNAAPLSVILDFSTGVTSFAGANSTLRVSSSDGNGVGALTGVTVDATGQVKLAYSNGKNEVMGSVALADFRNPNELTRAGPGLFQAASQSRSQLVTSGANGVGKVVSRQLEASNVNLAQEFGDLILIQRGFQASSQVVSVANDMIQQLFGIRGQG